MTSFSGAVATGNDDARGTNGANAVLNGTTLAMKTATAISVARMVLGIPQGATVNSGSFTVFSDASGNGQPKFTVYCEAIDDSPQPTTNENLTSRTKTTANLVVSASWANGAHALTVTSLLQEVVNRASYTAASYVTFIMQCNASADAVLTAYETGPGTNPMTCSGTYTAGGSPPGQVTGLSQTGQTSASIGIGWTNPGTATSFKIERSAANANTWSDVVSDTMSSGTTYNDTSLSTGTGYDYRVSGINASGTGTASAVGKFLTSTLIQNLTAVAASSSQVSLTWDAATLGATDISLDHYFYQKKLSGGAYGGAVSTGSTNSASVTGLTAASVYYFEAFAVIYRTSVGSGTTITGESSSEVSALTWATATAAPSTGHTAFAASATFTPVFHATSALSTGHTAFVASAQYLPIRTGSAAPSLGHTSLVASATFDKPVYTGAAAPSLGGVTFAASGATLPPTFTAAALLVTGAVNHNFTDLDATFSDPDNSATLALTIGHIAFAASGSVNNGTFTASAALVVGGLEFEANVVGPGARYFQMDVRQSYQFSTSVEPSYTFQMKVAPGA